jgi:hypothetical protein
MLHSGVRLRETSRTVGKLTCQGRLAQLGERCVRNAEVGGSIPPPSTIPQLTAATRGSREPRDRSSLGVLVPEPVEDPLDRPPGAALAIDQRHSRDALTRKCLGDKLTIVIFMNESPAHRERRGHRL